MSGMIEKVARAIAFSFGAAIVGPGQSRATLEFGWSGDGGHFDKYVEAHWKNYVHAATFAIEAMRHLDDATSETMSRHAGNGMVDWRDLHSAMIDAALEEPATKEIAA